jgi:hypothetical protein
MGIYTWHWGKTLGELVNKRWFMEGSSSSENIHQTTVK